MTILMIEGHWFDCPCTRCEYLEARRDWERAIEVCVDLALDPWPVKISFTNYFQDFPSDWGFWPTAGGTALKHYRRNKIMRNKYSPVYSALTIG